MTEINKSNTKRKVVTEAPKPKQAFTSEDFRLADTGFAGKTKTNLWPLVITATISISVSLIAVYAYLAR